MLKWKSDYQLIMSHWATGGQHCLPAHPVPSSSSSSLGHTTLWRNNQLLLHLFLLNEALNTHDFKLLIFFLKRKRNFDNYMRWILVYLFYLLLNGQSLEVLWDHWRPPLVKGVHTLQCGNHWPTGEKKKGTSEMWSVHHHHIIVFKRHKGLISSRCFSTYFSKNSLGTEIRLFSFPGSSMTKYYFGKIP